MEELECCSKVLAVDSVADAGDAVGGWGEVNEACHLIARPEAARLQTVGKKRTCVLS
jgi:hypothetical protein